MSRHGRAYAAAHQPGPTAVQQTQTVGHNQQLTCSAATSCHAAAGEGCQSLPAGQSGAAAESAVPHSAALVDDPTTQ